MVIAMVFDTVLRIKQSYTGDMIEKLVQQTKERLYYFVTSCSKMY